ncbi:25438_t:CDS:2 [Gigaspora rosea]|nr:25438_t:CDS:2 [Gigaspora rosea]
MLNSARKKLDGTINQNYPHDNTVFWKSKNGNYNYTVINLGTLPLQPILKYTQLPGSYSIPDNYEIETSWGRSIKNYVQASINYVEKTPHFKIEWTYNEQTYIVVSPILASDASIKYSFSGIVIFELQLYEELSRAISKRKPLQYVNPLSDLSNVSHRNKIKRVAVNLFNNFEAKKNKIWNSADNPKLKNIVLEADTSYDLPKEWLVSEEKHNIDKIMQMHIPLLVFDMKSQIQNSDSDSEEDVTTLEKGGYCSISKILQFVIPKLVASIKFEFWEDRETKAWKSKSLMGPDKLKVIENFNLNIMLPPVRATKVQKLWLGFCELYKMLGQDELTGSLFHNKAQEWIDLFLTPSHVIPGANAIVKGLYMPNGK